jgi:hypothetical protein
MAQCPTIAGSSELRIEGLATFYYQDIRTDRAADEAELYGQVCLIGVGQNWTVTAEHVRFLGLSDTPRLEIKQPHLTLPEWEIDARMLRTDEASLVLTEAAFRGGGVTGTAQVVAVDVNSGETLLEGVFARGTSYQVEAEKAELSGPSLLLERSVATTCVCDGPPAYLIEGTRAEISVEDQRILIHEGVLLVASSRIPLAEEVEIGSEALEEIEPPIELEYRGNDPESGSGGTGLGVVIPGLVIGDGFVLRAGVTGLDSEFPLRGFALLDVTGRGLQAEFGRGRDGIRSSVIVRQQLASWLDTVLRFQNLHDPDEDFLHQGVIGLEASKTSLPLGGDASATFSANLFAAASSQTLPSGSVADARLGAGGTIRLRSAPSPLGRIEVTADLEATRYPSYGETQYGLALRSLWMLRQEPLQITLRHLKRWTNGASPFSVELDRLRPDHRLSGQVGWSGRLAPRLQGSLALASAYDFESTDLDDATGVDRFTITSALSYQDGRVELEPKLEFELAGLLNSSRTEEIEAFVDAELLGSVGQYGAGLGLHYDLLEPEDGLKSLDLQLSFPLEVEPLFLRPFVAVNVAPFLTGTGRASLRGHGLEAEWRTCCGTLVASYRWLDAELNSSFGVRFGGSPEQKGRVP